MKKKLENFGFRRAVLGVADAFIVVVSSLITNFILSFSDKDVSRADMLISFVLCSVTCCGCLFIFGAYDKLWRFFHKRDYVSCLYGVASGFFFSGVFIYIIRETVNIGFLCLHAAITLLGVCLFRLTFKRMFVTIQAFPVSSKKRTMIVGGGQTCRLILTEIANAKKDPYGYDRMASEYEPVCIIDDDRNKIGSEINGITVVGSTSEIIKYVDQ